MTALMNTLFCCVQLLVQRWLRWRECRNSAVNMAHCCILSQKDSWENAWPSMDENWEMNLYWVSVQQLIIIITSNCKHCQATAKLAACTDFLSGLNLACNSGPVAYAYRFNFFWIGVLYRPYGAKKLPKCHNFNQIFTVWRLWCPFPFTDLSKFDRKL